MLEYPLLVFLDTNIFISAKYDFSDKGILNTLLNFVAAGKIKLYSNNIVEGEIKKHISNEISKLYNSFKNSRNSTFETVSENYLSQWRFEYLFSKPDKNEMLNEMLSAFKQFLQKADTVMLDCSNVDCNQIVQDYFAGKPPFANSDKKKFEFPDAIMIAKLKTVFNEQNSVCVVSDDKGFREAFSGHDGVKTFESLKEVFDLINKEQKTYESIIQFLSQAAVHTELCQEIQAALDNKHLDIDGLDCDRKGYCEGYGYDEVYIDNIENVDFKFMSVDEIAVDTVKITVTATALISATCTFLDSNNSIWDSEEREYVYSEWVNVDEKHEPKFECELIFEVKSETEDSGISFKLRAVNFDLSLDQNTRISQEIIPTSDPAEDALADTMDAMEEYYKH